MIIGSVLVIVAVAVDQLTKFIFFGNAPVSILGNFLWFQSTLNTGVAFGMFENSNLIFLIISILASIIFIYLLFSKKFFNSRTQKVCIGLILGGTISNLIDRIAFGGVRDFIYLRFINFAIFNIADMCVTISVIVFCAYLLFKTIKKDTKESGEKKHD